MHNHAQLPKLIASFTYRARQGAHAMTAYRLSYCSFTAAVCQQPAAASQASLDGIHTLSPGGAGASRRVSPPRGNRGGHFSW